jgi:hypothetical protein
MAGPYGYQNSFEESVSAVTATNTVELGAQRRHGGVEYRYVYNNGTTAVSPGYAVVISALSGWSVTISSVTEVSPPVGVVVHATMTTNTYGWVATKGIVGVEADVDQGITSGQKLYLGPDGVHVPVTGTTAFSQTSIPYIHGYALGTTASAGSVPAMINCFG